jgi:large subunit ribosomal protein L6
MSRVGKHPIIIPEGVIVNLTDGQIEISGKLGVLSLAFPDSIVVRVDSSSIIVEPVRDSKVSRMNWGTYQRHISNMVNGVTKGFTLNIEIVGVGYRAAVQGSSLELQLGHSHSIKYPLPQGVSAVCSKPTSVSLTGTDRQLLGQVAAEIQEYRPPEPYKGKGVIKAGEFVLRKVGKKK